VVDKNVLHKYFNYKTFCLLLKIYIIEHMET
jgi:hypothetical protein